MRDVGKVYVRIPSNQIYGTSFWDGELWESEHVLDYT